MTAYRDAERLRQAKWIVNHPMDYTDREIRRAGKLARELEAKARKVAPVPTTALQESVIRAVAMQIQAQLAQPNAVAGSPLDVTAKALAARLGRVGQVVGHSAGELTRKGLLRRTAPATYRLTVTGLEWLRSDSNGGA